MRGVSAFVAPTLFAVVWLLELGSPARAEPQARSVSVFGGPDFRSTTIADRFTIMTGATACLMTGDWQVGVSGELMERRVEHLSLGFFGLHAGYSLRFAPRFGLTIAATAAGGVATHREHGVTDRSRAFVVEPEVSLWGTTSGYSRIAVGVGHRRVFLSASSRLDEADLSATVVGVHLMYGGFGDEDVGRRRRVLEVSGLVGLRVAALRGGAAILHGGATRFTFRRRYAMGIAAYKSRSTSGVSLERPSLGYGGILGEVHIAQKGAVQLSVRALVGFGRISFREPTDSRARSRIAVVESDAFLVFRLADMLRLAAGGGYRLTVPLARDYALSTRQASGLSTSIELRFGGG